MSDELEFYDDSSVPPPSGSEMTAIETWIAAVTKPNAATFEMIAAQPGASAGKAFLWAALAALVSAFFGALSRTVGAGQSMEMMREFMPPELTREIPVGGGGAFSFGALICGAPLGAIFGVIFFAIGVALILWIAKMFGGSGEFDKLAYTFAAIMVPVAAVNAVLALLGMIPFIGILFGLVSVAVVIYSLVLHIFAVQAVTGLDTGKSAASVLIPGLVIFLFFCCCLVLGLAVMGASMGEVFNQLNQGF